jgi:hypothetical protein
MYHLIERAKIEIILAYKRGFEENPCNYTHDRIINMDEISTTSTIPTGALCTSYGQRQQTNTARMDVNSRWLRAYTLIEFMAPLHQVLLTVCIHSVHLSFPLSGIDLMLYANVSSFFVIPRDPREGSNLSDDAIQVLHKCSVKQM